MYPCTTAVVRSRGSTSRPREAVSSSIFGYGYRTDWYPAVYIIRPHRTGHWQLLYPHRYGITIPIVADHPSHNPPGPMESEWDLRWCRWRVRRCTGMQKSLHTTSSFLRHFFGFQGDLVLSTVPTNGAPAGRPLVPKQDV